MFKKVLIVNRGEIAVRVIRACREMGITAAVIYSDADKESLHVRLSDEAYHIGPSPASQSYLDISEIISIAKNIGADAIHPGYGFLSENAGFIKKVEESGIIFIGPGSNSVEAMGEKTAARKIMQNSGVPIVPGTIEPIVSLEEAKSVAREIGYPIMLKASAGGGGKGMRKILSDDEFDSAYRGAKSEAAKSFGNDEIYIEKFIENPKHIEVQIIADKLGNYRHLFERECSIQRRHQKIIEESPSASVDNETRIKVTTTAIDAAKAVNYINAGTVEFLMDQNNNVYFLEMNTRLQVEHPVTELITGFDLVKEQINVAAGNKISFSQNEVSISGHAVECRIYAEHTENNFAPSTGTINYLVQPSGPGVRLDSGIEQGNEVSIFYDPMLAKLITYGKDRDEAIKRMQRALSEYHIVGVHTNIPALKWILMHNAFIDASFNINFIEEKFLPLLPDLWREIPDTETQIALSALGAYIKLKDTQLNTNQVKITRSNSWSSINNG